ncbi:MAG: hypothetical protein HY788_21455 [Deltaproteobacteria bacterium]|nr:hypothetical protein [Deltaproteobacteria bacterium]
MMKGNCYKAGISVVLVLFLASFSWAAKPFAAPAQFDFGAGSSSFNVQMTVEGGLQSTLPVSFSPMPVPITGILKVTQLETATGSFSGAIKQLGGQTTASVTGLPSFSVTLTLDGGVSGVFRWSSNSVFIYPTSLTATLDLGVASYAVPISALVISGDYDDGRMYVNAEMSASDTFSGRTFSIQLAITLEAFLEELNETPEEPTPSDDFSGIWNGTWVSSMYPGDGGQVDFLLCQSGIHVSGDSFVTDTDCGDVQVPVTGIVDGDTMAVSMEYICAGINATSDYTQATRDDDTVTGVYKAWTDGHNLYDEGTFSLFREPPKTLQTNGLWKEEGGSWFVQKYSDGGALVIYSADLKAFTVYGIDSASGLKWTSNPDMGTGRYSIEITFQTQGLASVAIRDNVSQQTETRALNLFSSAVLQDSFKEADGIWKGAGSWFVQRYDNCGALVIYTEDMSSYRVYGIDSAAGEKWISDPDLNSGQYSVDMTFSSPGTCTSVVHTVGGSASETHTLSKFAGTE